MLLSDDPTVETAYELQSSQIEANWPADVTIAVCLTFDTQGAIDGLGEGTHYQTTTTWPNGAPNWWDYSERQYGIECGLPRILDILDEFDVTATFPTCGMTADWYPERIAEIHEREHTIANHSYSHRLPSGLDADEINEEIKKGREAIESLIGERPRGWRSPAFALNESTVDSLIEQDYVWDSSLHNRDLPYLLSNGEDHIVELPAGHIDDWTLYMMSTGSDVGHMGGYPRGTPGGVLDVLTSEFDRLYAEANSTTPRLFMYTMHPKITGRPHRADTLRAFLEYISNKPGVWFASCDDIADLAMGRP